ncbi:unnamed protein product, partial [Prunus brigantina]
GGKLGVLEWRNRICGEGEAGGYAGHYLFSLDLTQNDVVLASSKRSHQQLQGTSKLIFLASKRSCDPIDPTVAPPL